MPNKIYIAGRNQTKTVTPSNVQQTVVPDTNYNALDSVVVNPIKAAMPQTVKEYVMRTTEGDFSLNLDGNVPPYACYTQINLVAVYGDIIRIGDYAFYGCTGLGEINLNGVTYIGASAFNNCVSLRNVSAPQATTLSDGVFRNCTSLISIDVRNAVSFPDYTFNSCQSLCYVDCRNLNSVNGSVGFSTSNLEIIDLTNRDTPTTIRTEGFKTPSPIWKAIVKNDAVKTLFQSATNWSVFADHVYTVAEIESLYGDTYDNLYLQWFGHPRFDS